MARPKKDPNSLIAAAQVTAKDLTIDRPRREKDVLDRTELLGVSSKVAECHICNRNWPWKNAYKYFENEPLMRKVDKFYPWAKGGPLYVDEPVTAEDKRLCELKRPYMKQERLRYVVIEQDMTEHEVRSQLEGA